MKPWLLLFLWQIPRLLSAQTDTMFVELASGTIKAYSTDAINQLTFSKEGPTSVEDLEKMSSIFTSFTLKQNYPNPFNPSTTIEYEIPTQGEVEVAIFDIQGKKVREVERTVHNSGSYRVVWDSKDEGGTSVASGTYFYRVQYNGTQLVNKLLLLK